MARLDKDLIKRIHSGKCIILVGSGASLEAGYPSWRQLAEKLLLKNEFSFSKELYKNLEKSISGTIDDLLTVFDEIEKKISKEALVSQIKEIFDAVPCSYSDIHSVIAKWPIPFYLTTNYDSEINKYLLKNDFIFTEKSNTEEEFMRLSASSDREIYKIHGDFTNPNTMIITKKDYQEIRNSSKYDYWRKKMQSILMLCDILLIGYSAKDPDFQDQLEIAKKYANPDKPIYMFSCDMTSDEIVELRSTKNIKVISYENKDRTHNVLRQLLHNYDRFIPKRNSSLINKTEELLKESELASSMFIFNDTFFNNNKIIAKALYNCILHVIEEKNAIDTLSLKLELQNRKISADEVNIGEAISDLLEYKYIQDDPTGILTLTDNGEKLLSISKQEFNDYRFRFKTYCELTLLKKSLPQDTINKIISYIDNGLVVLFKKRGIEIAKKVIAEDIDNDISATFDIADSLSEIEKKLNPEEYDYFIDLLFNVLETPSKEIRDYLAILCNGYFTYHILGHDENSRNKRLDFIKKNKIYLDSSILLPLLADSCQNNRYAIDLINLIKELNSNLYITHNLLKEVISHVEWAIRHCAKKNISDFDIYLNALEIGYSKENLFVLGAINWCNRNGYNSFDSYLEHVFGDDYEENLEKCVIEKLEAVGIRIKDKSQFENFVPLHHAMYEEYIIKIREDRKTHNSYRSELQCETEAEMLVISNLESINFLTHTKNLKRFESEYKISHWFPEGIYRFIQMNQVSLDLDDLYNCMITGMYTCGIKSINKEDLVQITKPFIRQAELRLSEIEKSGNEEIKKYLSKKHIEDEKENLTLPFYTSQIEYILNESIKASNELTTQKLAELEKQEKSIALHSAERNEYEWLKNKKKQKQMKQQNKKSRNKKKRK